MIARGRLVEGGYEIEVRIPLKSLRFQGTDEQRWALNVVRYVQHTGYQQTWMPTRRGAASFLVQSGTLTGFKSLSRDLVAEINERVSPFRILTGIEVDILDDGSLDQTDELLGRLDVVVASVHSKLRMESELMTPRMIAAVRNPHVDILGHCTGRMVTGKGRPQSTFDADAVFSTAAESDTAVEINCRPERLDPPKALLRKVVAAGCKVSIDTDAHAPGQLDWLGNGCERAVACAVPPDRVLNTWPVDRLLDRTRS
mgnify:CR=1 FL=1